MKTQFLKTIVSAAVLTFLTGPALAEDASTGYVAHEWGTFTSVQGGDGELLRWRPLRNSELPGFVYNWSRAGMNRGMAVAGKAVVGQIGGLVTLQRMETPVIYFYAEKTMNVSVDVSFPKGFITEWYPQASKIGPTFPANPDLSTNGILYESRAVWQNLEIVPKSKYHGWLEDRLLQDSSGSHYFAARDTGASMVRADFTMGTNNSTETEKFIFYRGAGSFKTPLRVSVNDQQQLVLENSGLQKLTHMFLVSIHNGHGAFAVKDELENSAPWERVDFDTSDSWHRYSIADFPAAIGKEMESALKDAGLFADEAKAMVNTWKDSWFTEPGVRVLYILPRAWTDETLPLTLKPQAKDLVRVMVGRAEVIVPSAVEKFRDTLSKADKGDENARKQAELQMKTFGRFAEPALTLAASHTSDTNLLAYGFQLLYPRTKSAFE
jgi:hypothetical protein